MHILFGGWFIHGQNRLRAPGHNRVLERMPDGPLERRRRTRLVARPAGDHTFIHRPTPHLLIPLTYSQIVFSHARHFLMPMVPYSSRQVVTSFM